jgi:outer membrane protein OmpA-like peptidoglycan-associated protein
MDNVMEMVHSPWMGEIVGKFSGTFRESPEGVKRGFESAVPLSVVGLAQRAATHEGAEELLSTLRAGQYPRLDEQELGKVATDPASAARVALSSQSFLSRLFGSKQGGVVDGLASSAGVSPSSASKLLGLALPMVLGFVGKQTASRNLDANGLSGFLASQRKLVGDALPGPLSRLVGGDGEPRAAATGHPAVGYAFATPRARIGKLWILPLAALTLLVLLMARRGGRHETPAVQRAPQTQALTDLTRPLALRAGGVTAFSQAITGTHLLPQTFVLSDLTFRTDSAEIDPGSARVLDDLAQVMAANPGARIRVEGHTDNAGEAAANQQLSQARAEATRAYLISKGIAGDRIEAAGRGQDRPLASNDQPRGRAENRRTEVVLLSR